jgi:5-methylcytosine-specific restriction endonuclease McrA
MGNINICRTVKKPAKAVVQKKKAIPKALKRCVWDTYIGAEIGKTLCLCCQHVYIRQIEFHCGHVIPEDKGGETTIDNLRPICAQCNLSMGTQNMNEFMKLFKKK